VILIKRQIFNSVTTAKFKGISSLIGIAIFVLSYYYSSTTISNFKIENLYNSLEQIIVVVFGSTGLILGLILILAHFNFKNIAVIICMFLFIGLWIGVSIYNDFTRNIIMTFLVELTVFGVVVIIFKFFSTITTLIVSSYIYLFILFLIVKFFGLNFQINLSIFLYTLVTAFLIIFQLTGVKLNKFFIRKIMNQKKISEEYNYDLLKSHINIIYLLVFVIINVSGLIYEQSTTFNFSNIINNCFLTILAFNQIDWKKFKL
jgi:hypothetical protein